MLSFTEIISSTLVYTILPHPNPLPVGEGVNLERIDKQCICSNTRQLKEIQRRHFRI